MGSSRKKKRKLEYPIININDREANEESGYPSNKISTTRYSILTFIPKNLFEQFRYIYILKILHINNLYHILRRVTNIYFLTIAIISAIPQISPFIPFTTFLPLIFVLSVSAIKDGWEDYRRYKSDKLTNRKVYDVLSGETFEPKKSENINVGDIVKLYEDDEVPADILILKSSDSHGVVYADTANLDGETTLKPFKSRSETMGITDKQIISLKGKIEAEMNHQDLYKFRGNMTINGIIDEKVAINEENLLLRGSRIRNTSHCIGVVVYAGKDTKIMLNSNHPPSKWSLTERKINRVVIAIFIVKFLLSLGCAVASALYEHEIVDNAYFLTAPELDRSPAFRGFLSFWSYFAIFSYFIPISLMVSLELAKLIQAMFISWDLKLTNPETGEGMSVNNSNLNDELARAKYIFCDKTGTLTENKMVFDRCSIGMVSYNKARKKQLKSILNNSSSPKNEVKRIKEFLIIMATCNTALAELAENKKYYYQAQSPDEICLCNFARDNGIILKERRNDEIVVNVLGKDVVYKVLNVLDFSSERKRMSIILRTPKGKIVLYSKGADNVMLERVRKDENKDLIKVTKDYLEDYSSDGLRTLIICKKELDEKEYKDYISEYNDASTLLEGRKKALAAVFDKIERDMKLVGCTAIEDKLQEEVPETIAKFISSGLKVWMITGDKQSTAINIASACNLIQKDYKLLIINAYTSDDVKNELNKSLAEARNADKAVLIIDGGSLSLALAQFKDLLLELCKICVSVVCCRTTPIQKALVVRMMKKGTDQITLSIGDGANDVSMLREAHIGVGIYGQEGSQAARCSDYAIYRFKDLHRLICIHGRYNLIRSSSFIQYSFYKNLAMFLVQLWFAYFCIFSAQTIHDDIIMAIFNVAITSLPPLFLGIFERDVPEKTLLQHPQSHKQIANSEGGFTYHNFIHWVLSAVWHSLVIFFVPFALVAESDIVHKNGRVIGIWEFGTIISTIGVVIVLIRAALLTHWWNIIVHFGIWISLLGYFLIFLVQSFLPNVLGYMLHVFGNIFSSPSFVFIIPLSTVIALLPDFVYLYVKRNYFYEDSDILQELSQN